MIKQSKFTEKTRNKILSKLTTRDLAKIVKIKESLKKVKIPLYLCGVSKYYPEYLKFSSKNKKHYTKHSEDMNVKWGESFCDYANNTYKDTLKLMWTDIPKPGNYGDWLSPYIISKILGVNITHVDDHSKCKSPHLVALGSIIDCANSNSIVIGSGISDKNANIDITATFISVRGPYTKKRIEELGGTAPDKYGDIGFLMRRLYKPKKVKPSHKYVIVRHTKQSNISIKLPSGFKEISIFRSKERDIEEFIDICAAAEIVYTSAMHCFITCISYGIPCVLFSLGDDTQKVPGDGVKYLDALSGVKLPEINPIKISIHDNLYETLINQEPYVHMVSDEELDKIESYIFDAFNQII